MVSALVAERGRDRNEGAEGRSHKRKQLDPVVGLRMMLERLRRTEAKAFQEFQDSWKTERWTESFTAQLDTIERSLR